MTGRFLLIIALATSGCSETKSTTGEEKKKDGAPAAIDASPSVVLPGGARLPKPADLQPGFKASQMKFLGWSKDGSKFVIRAVHTAPKWEYMDAGVATYELIQVHDALSGMMLLAFQRRRDGKPVAGDDDTKMWRSAAKRDEWPLWSRANPLVPPTPTLSHGEWTLRGRVSRGTADRLDKFALKKRKNRFDVVWTVRRGEGRNLRKRPVVKIDAKGKSETRKSLKLTIPFKPKTFVDEIVEEVRVLGNIEAFFSPSGNRLVWISNHHFAVDNDAFPAADARFFLRSLGPQIKIVDAGAGLDRARAVALLLEKNGLAVTVVETAEEPSKTTQLYYRDRGEAAATVAAKLLPGVTSEKLSKDGWIDLIVFLGEQ